MPLEHSSSPAALHRNMHTLFGDIGKSPHVQSRKQAVAIALETQRRAGRADGGGVDQDTIGIMAALSAPGGIAALQQGVSPDEIMGAGNPSQPVRRGGVIRHYDAGGGVDPVSAVINALSAGTQVSGVSAPAGASNPSAPSSPTATATTAPPAANTQAQNQGQPQGIAAPGTVPSPTSAAGVMPTPNNPIQQKLMNTGGALKRASGGFDVAKGPQLRPSFYERGAQRQLHVGPVLSNVPGRTDHHQIQVPAGSYVIPSETISHLGQNNTMAGMSIAHRMFSGPYGTAAPRMGGHSTMPRPPRPMTQFAIGGVSEGGSRGEGHPSFEGVPVDVAGGEYIVDPRVLIAKFGSLKAAHKIMDRWIMNLRKDHIKTLKDLPPPAKK